MSVELREAKRRVGSVRQIYKATSAMEKISSASLGRDKVAVLRSTKYVSHLNSLLARVLRQNPSLTHPLMMPGKGETCVVLFGSDRGLCGGFNSALMEKVRSFMRQQPDPDKVTFIVVGKVAQRRIRSAGYRLHSFHRQPPQQTATSTRHDDHHDNAAVSEVISTLSGIVTDGFLTGSFGSVHLIYSLFVSSIRQDPVIDCLLPFAPPALDTTTVGQSLSDAIFEPSPAGVVDALLPECVLRFINHACLNSVASETGARQTAMHRATDNANEMLDDLKLLYSRLRQEDITTQMLELVGGSLH